MNVSCGWTKSDYNECPQEMAVFLRTQATGETSKSAGSLWNQDCQWPLTLLILCILRMCSAELSSRVRTWHIKVWIGGSFLAGYVYDIITLSPLLTNFLSVFTVFSQMLKKNVYSFTVKYHEDTVVWQCNKQNILNAINISGTCSQMLTSVCVWYVNNFIKAPALVFLSEL